MKKIHILVVILLTFVNHISAQIDLSGSASYQLNIEGDMGRRSNGCGDIDGLREIRIIRSNSRNSEIILNNRYINSPFSISNPVSYVKSNPITEVIVKKIIRWKEWCRWGIFVAPVKCCDGGPENKWNNYNISNECFVESYYNQGDGLNRITISSKPVINIPLPSNPLYLTDTNYLTVTIPDNIDNKYFKWKYSVGGSYPRDIPYSYNYKPILRIKGSDFLSEEDFGKNVSVWIDLKNVCSYCENPSPINFVYQKSLPHIIKQSLSLTSCYNTNDGKITLYFDRDLVEEETLSFSITRNGQPYTLENKYRDIIRLDSNRTCTIENLPKGNYKLRMYGKYKGKASYSPYSNTDYNFSIGNPPPVDFVFSKTDVYCNGGNDGSITVTASGGIGRGYEYKIDNNQWVAFPNNTKTTTIRGLSKGTYTLSVRDGNGCIARKQIVAMMLEIILGEIKNKKIIITEPQQPLSIIYTEQRNPTFHGASNGKIIAKIEGGTIFDNNSYLFEIKKDNVSLTSLATTEFSNGAFYIILDNITEGTYFFKVYDKNYSAAIQKEGCSILNSSITLSHPPALQATLSVEKPISCNRGNEFGNERDREMDGQRDESQDGILQIRAQGGTPFTGTANGGRPYKYTWKKQNPNGSWQLLPFEGDTAMNLSQGRYAINIEDANGIKLGRYNTHTNTLEALTDVVYELREPDPLTLSLEKMDVTCRGNDGKITAVPTGGTPPYRYLWSNGATTASIEDLLPMPYTVEIKDEAGCIVQGSTVVMQPNSLTVTGTITPLRCHNASNAAIALAVQGGTAPYQYLWNTGATTSNISNLPLGEYKVKITDAQGCAYFKTFIIENPPKFEIDLGGNRTLCNGQTLTLNIAINDPQATYLWTGDNGFSSNMPQVTLSEKSTYRATVTTKDGCTATDAITIESANTQIASEFLLTTQAYENEEVILVNTSSPKGETTQWLMPEDDNIEITKQNDDYISLVFKAKGEYRIGIKQTQGNCFELFYKNIIVEPATDLPKTEKTNEAYVREFEVAPNPNNGKFKAKVVLEKAGAIKFRLYSITGQLVNEKNSASATEHWVDFQDPLPAATYILVLETPYQRLSKKIIIIP